MIEDSLQSIIIKYVREHDGPTQTQIIDYMRGKNKDGEPVEEKSPIPAVLQTTLNALDTLTGKTGDPPMLILLPDENNRRKYRYYIIDSFKVIYDLLEEIDNSILMMDPCMRKFNKIIPFEDKRSKEISFSNPKQVEFQVYLRTYVVPYTALIRTMLFYIFEKLSVIKIPKEHRNNLYSKCIELINRLNEQTLELKTPEVIIEIKNQILEGKRELNNPGSMATYYFKHEALDKLIILSENFDRRFWSKVIS